MELVLHLAALVSCVLLALHVARVRASPSRGWFLAFLLAVSWWAACASAARVAGTADGFLLPSRLAFVGIVAVPVLWDAFTRAFVHAGGGRRRRAVALAIVPAATLALLPFASPQLVIAGVREVGGSFELVRGTWYWAVHLPYTYALLALGVVRLLRFSRRSTTAVRQQVAVVVGAILVPLGANVVERLGTVRPGVDLTVVAFTVAALLIGWALLARRFLELTPADYRDALDAEGCVLVVDGHGRVVDANPAAAELLRLERTATPIALGRVLPSVSAALRRAPDRAATVLVVTPNLPSRTTRVHILPLPSVGGGGPGGHVLTLYAADDDAAAGAAAPTTSSIASP